MSSVITALSTLLLASAATIALTPAVAQTVGQPESQTGPQGGEDRTGLPDSYRGPVSAVAAIVNDQVITTYDVEQRVSLIAISSGGQVTAEILPQLQAQALRDLIEEKLKFIEAGKFELKADPTEVERELAAIAGQSGTSIQQLESSLNANGVSLDGLREQIAAGQIWPRLVQGRYGSRIRISDEEIDRTRDRMREEAGEEQYLVSEICIPVPSQNEAQAYYEGSLQLIEQMRRGVPFAVVAQQFSACSSAANGGDLGWVRPGELPTELDEVIKTLPLGSVSSPVPSDGAFMIMAVRDKREAVQRGEKSFTLAYASAPLDIGRNAARAALEKLETAGACESGQRQDLGPDVSIAMVENAKLSEIDPRFHTAIEDLDRGDLSPAIEADGALHVAYICEVDEGLGIPSRRTLEDRLYGRQLNRISQQYLRDVERKTMVDIRLGRQSPLGAGG